MSGPEFRDFLSAEASPSPSGSFSSVTEADPGQRAWRLPQANARKPVSATVSLAFVFSAASRGGFSALHTPIRRQSGAISAIRCHFDATACTGKSHFQLTH